MKKPEIYHINPYVEPTVELVLSLLADAYGEEDKLDKVLDKLSDEVVRDLIKALTSLEKKGKIDLNAKINLANHPALYYELKQIEKDNFKKVLDYYYIAYNVITESMKHSYTKTMEQTFKMFNYGYNQNGEKTFQPAALTVQTTDTYLTEKVLNIPWCQDGKVYSQRLYSNVANFQSKLAFVLEEGIKKGKGMEWMTQAWRKLTKSAAYDTARLLKTETMAMWSIATKESYLTMGIEYVEIVGDAECGGICLDYMGDPVPLREAEIGDLLPPYHPNCACSFVAYTEEIPVEELSVDEVFEDE